MKYLKVFEEWTDKNLKAAKDITSKLIDAMKHLNSLQEQYESFGSVENEAMVGIRNCIFAIFNGEDVFRTTFSSHSGSPLNIDEIDFELADDEGDDDTEEVINASNELKDALKSLRDIVYSNKEIKDVITEEFTKEFSSGKDIDPQDDDVFKRILDRVVEHFDYHKRGKSGMKKFGM